jgi:predicted PurR-regulated permease PerM
VFEQPGTAPTGAAAPAGDPTDWDQQSRKALALTRLHDLAVTRGQFLPRDRVVDVWARRAFAVSRKFLALPRQLAGAVTASPEVRAQIEALGLTDTHRMRVVVGGIGRNVAKFGLAVFALFFLYRHGDSVLAQFRGVASRWLGKAAHGYIQAVGVTVRAVVFGIVLTAMAQGALAGLGYWVAGVTAPALWGGITALVSLIPFVGPVVWISLSLGLLAQGETQAALGLFLWGALVVSWVDNLIRPLVISGPTKIPFLLVFLGVLGGLNAFGLIGLFLGPVLLAVSVAIWREWLGSVRPNHGGPRGGGPGAPGS